MAVIDTQESAASQLPPQPAMTELSGNLGFLSIIHDPSGLLGGYLVTNGWGRPLEFRISTAIQPNRVQQILYGPTLTDYLYADLIGKALVEKSSTAVGMVIVDQPAALQLRRRVDVPVVCISPAPLQLHEPDTEKPQEYVSLTHPRSSVPLRWLASHASDQPLIEAILAKVDPSLDLSEPFTRVREAIGEARKLGGIHRAA